jgi:hypothetical protein
LISSSSSPPFIAFFANVRAGNPEVVVLRFAEQAIDHPTATIMGRWPAAMVQNVDIAAPGIFQSISEDREPSAVQRPRG